MGKNPQSPKCQYCLSYLSREWVQQPEELDVAYPAAHAELADIRKNLNTIETEIKEKKVFHNHLTDYFKMKYLVAELKVCKNDKARQKYRDEHEDDFVILNAAKRYFDSMGLKKLPSYKALQSEVEQLIKEKNALYNRYRFLSRHPEIEYEVYEKNFLDRNDAIAWICKNQLGRRNLTP